MQPSTARLYSIADRHPLGSANESRSDVFCRRRQVYRFQSRQQLAKEGPQFHSSEMRAETEMHSDAECEMLIGVGAGHVKAEWIFKYRAVAIARQIRQQHPIAGPKPGRAQREILLRIA